MIRITHLEQGMLPGLRKCAAFTLCTTPPTSSTTFPDLLCSFHGRSRVEKGKRGNNSQSSLLNNRSRNNTLRCVSSIDPEFKGDICYRVAEHLEE